ncbi:hypothetical protein CAPTEDRAFT_208675 [Capitella teleta]|uniref:Uncharacterized protein n=1 Tax=Capitella teleta TaxID=283909 RepID=R7TVB1_CAPTE|nr:hypothetical protein CAPTEDRAFT_208675 [Capitella teleta]|eukprot:ELT95401.1 hypothetical protein CAPTEDRAFT_208675 [Capitella teleta]
MASANFSRSVLSRSAAESPAEGKGSESKKKMGFGSKIRVPLLGKSKKVKKVGKLTEENLMRHTVDLHSPLEHRAMLQQHIDRHNDFLLQNQFQNPPPILQQYDDDDAVTPLTRELPVDVPKPHATHNGTSPYVNTTKTPDKPTPVIAIPPRPTDHGAPRDGRKKRPSPPPPPPSTVEAVGTPTRTPTSSRNNCDSIAADLSSVCVSKKSFSRENSLNCGLDKSEDDKNSSGDLLRNPECDWDSTNRRTEHSRRRLEESTVRTRKGVQCSQPPWQHPEAPGIQPTETQSAKSEHSINQMPPDFGNLKKAPGLNPIAEERENVAPKTKKKRRTERCLSVDASSRNKAKKAKKKALGSEQIDNQQRSQSLDNLAGGEEVAADPASRTTSSNGEKGKEGSKKSKRGRKKSKPTPIHKQKAIYSYIYVNMFRYMDWLKESRNVIELHGLGLNFQLALA